MPNNAKNQEDKRQNEIIRIQKKRNNFVMLDKGFLNDDKLSFKSKGILAYLLSKPDNWKVIVGDLVNHSIDGKKAVYSGLRELKEHGYYKKIPVRDETGRRISHWESVIFECPDENPEHQSENSQRSLLSQNGEVEKTSKNTASSLLTHFVDVDSVQVQNDDIQNGQRNNNYMNKNDLTKIKSMSVSTSDILRTDVTLTNDNDLVSDGVYNCKNEKEFPSTAEPSKASGLQENSLVNTHCVTDNYIRYRDLLQQNIDYPCYLHNRQGDIEYVNELLTCMLDVICTDGDKVKINGEYKSRELVKSVYLELDKADIDHVLVKYKEQSHKIKHTHSYLKTMLYTVKQDSEHSVTNAVKAATLKKIDGVCTSEPIKTKTAKEYKNRFANFKQREWNYSEIERLERLQLKKLT